MVERVEKSDSVDMLAGAIERVAGRTAASFYRQACALPATRRLSNRGPSRQARHARVRRLTHLAIAACPLLALERADYRAFILSPDFGRLFPYSMAGYTRVEFMARQYCEAAGPDGWEPLWRAAAASLFDAVRPGSRADEERALRAEAAVAVMFSTVVIFGPALQPLVWDIWTRAGRLGLLHQSRYLRMQLSLMAAFVGRSEPHLEWMLEPGSAALDIADACCFVRRDFTPHRLSTLVLCVADQIERPNQAYLPGRPLSTLCRLVEYARTCMRNPGHFHTPSLMLMLLGWVGEARRELPQVQGAGGDDAGLDALARSIRRFETVQVMEKARFWQEVDRLPLESIGRQRLLDLW